MPASMLERIQATFACGRATDEDTRATIRATWEQDGVLLDTHTAVGRNVLSQREADGTPRILLSTASPFKFTRSVMQAIGEDDASLTDMELTDKLSEVAKVEIPGAIEEIRSAEVRHKTICEVDEMPQVVRNFLQIS